jgi:MFS transporter, UMF1 family
MGSASLTLPQSPTSKTANAWAFYDWANSVYPLVITTAIFPIFYENLTHSVQGNSYNDNVIFFGQTFKNTELYSYVIALSFLLVTAVIPVLSGIADYSGSKKTFMKFFCYMGALSCASLFFFNVENLEWGMLSVFFASLGFWGSLVFYNAFLPEIAPPEMHDKLSAKGYSLGYIGSCILLILNLIFIMNYELFGFESPGMPTRIAFLSVGAWWVGFAQITFLYLPEKKKTTTDKRSIVLKGFRELNKVWNELKDTPRLKRFLVSFFVYSMAVQTVMLMAVLFGKKEIEGMQDTNLIISVLLIQLIGAGGAHLLSFISSKIGNIAALSITIIAWILICAGAFLFVYKPFDFYVAAAAVGLVMGGIQALSRSTYAKLLPKTADHASYFSFYEVLEKFGIVIGMFLFGFMERTTGSMRSSILLITAFFLIAFLLLLRVPKHKTIAPSDI